MAPPPQPKRQRLSTPSNIASSALDHHLESVLALSDPSVPFDLSLERILESRVLESDKEDLIHVALRVGSALVDSARRSARKLAAARQQMSRAVGQTQRNPIRLRRSRVRAQLIPGFFWKVYQGHMSPRNNSNRKIKLAAAHNSLRWALPPELTLKVLSYLDTTSLCYAFATCTTFSKCASDPLCYENIDLTRNGNKVHNYVVSTMIQRAGKNLKSLKLGFESKGNWRDCLLTNSCLIALSSDHGASGALLQKLSLNKVDDMDTDSLIFALSKCKSLIDLEIIGIRTIDLKRTLTAVSEHCPLIERLCFDYSGFDYVPVLYGYYFGDILKKCNMLSSLAIRGCMLYDCVLHEIIKKLSKLKYADFSSCRELKGFLFKNLGKGDGGESLETLILRDCSLQTIDAIGPFFNAILDGKWKSLRFLDVSSRRRQLIVRCVDLSDASSSSSDQDSQNEYGQNLDDSSSNDQVTKNGHECGLNDSSSELLL